MAFAAVVAGMLLTASVVMDATKGAESDGDSQVGDPAFVPTTAPGPDQVEVDDVTVGDPSDRADVGVFETLEVGVDIQPGRHVAEPDAFCWWELRDGPDPGSAGLHSTGVTSGGRVVLDVSGTDTALRSTGCGRWEAYGPPREPAESFGAGDWVVGVDIRTGTYRGVPDQSGADCDWERASGFAHTPDEIVDAGDGRGGTTIDVAAGERLSVHACAWTFVVDG